MVLGVPLSHHLTSAQRRAIGAWLLGCAGMVYGAVALGGITRHDLNLQKVLCSSFICLIKSKIGVIWQVLNIISLIDQNCFQVDRSRTKYGQLGSVPDDETSLE